MRESVKQFPNMNQTIGGLTPACIYATDAEGKTQDDPVVYCMFNPYEYSVSKSNSYAEKAKANAEAPDLELQQAGPQTLKLNLVFDTYEEGEDVTLLTRKLWELMEPRSNGKGKPGAPFVAFEWHYFKFVSVITNMTQKFTLFLHDGMPVRAQVDITFTQHFDQPDYQNPTSGGGPAQQLHTVISGERLEAIAASVYGDAGLWRLIADYNNITNPLALRPGQQLLIPEAN
jgi:nucleoid-associated protein YgaU